MAEPSEVLAAFGARVAHHRQKQGMSQAELAEAAGVNRVTISRVERGLQDLGIARLVALCDALGRKPGELLCTHVMTDRRWTAAVKHESRCGER